MLKDKFKTLKSWRRKRQVLYTPDGHRKSIVVSWFYAKQIIKSVALLFVGYVPLDTLKTTYVNLIIAGAVSGKTEDKNSVFLTQQVGQMYAILASGLFLLMLWLIIYKVNWNYVEFQEHKLAKKQAKKDFYVTKDQLPKKDNEADTLRPLDRLKAKYNHGKEEMIATKEANQRHPNVKDEANKDQLINQKLKAVKRNRRGKRK